eukprot:2180490-Pleurochrysis_carterae.AAC.5
MTQPARGQRRVAETTQILLPSACMWIAAITRTPSSNEADPQQEYAKRPRDILPAGFVLIPRARSQSQELHTRSME